MRVAVVGFKELDEALAQLPKSLRRELVLGALKKAAEPMVREAKARVRRQANPRVRGGVPAGELKPLADSITVSAVKANSEFPNEIAVKLGPDADHFYGLFVEKGTKRRGRVYRDDRGKFRRNKRRHSATRAFEFLGPAFAMHSERTAVAIGEELWRALAKKAEDLARKANKGTLSKKAKESLLD
ncbi:MAG: HK97 gp10 family phage protein [Planctomycetaceae bacterium]|nr:HK97 gp10 family phage protein [Planctomycetota bacterium]NUN51228.1 HK97 gp10 family phage protein [Planctomycetaceae bacterium]